ncbi:MAG: hypothetical protein KDA24_13970 [Deltaproteobacteria bacterium]|nr:hypothetical protein [Deltaproteobacteria bacterium]
MERTKWMILLCALALALPGCPTRGSSGDDDDVANDDDSATADDDDATSDDDDATSDDDDSGDDDDDDATGDDDDSTLVDGNTTLEGIWYIQYWQDAAQTVPVCQQAYRFSGLSETRVGVLGTSCPMCTAKIDVTNVMNVTAGIPIGDPFEAAYTSTVTNPCNATSFPGGSVDYGSILAATGVSPGGDFLLQQGLIDAGSGAAQGLNLTQDGATSFTSLAASYSGSGVSLTHVGYVNESGGGQLTELGLETIAEEASPGSGWWPYWTYYTQGGATNGQLLGQYGIGSLWLLTSNGQGIDYETVTFSGTLVGQ